MPTVSTPWHRNGTPSTAGSNVPLSPLLSAVATDASTLARAVSATQLEGMVVQSTTKSTISHASYVNHYGLHAAPVYIHMTGMRRLGGIVRSSCTDPSSTFNPSPRTTPVDAMELASFVGIWFPPLLLRKCNLLNNEPDAGAGTVDPSGLVTSFDPSLRCITNSLIFSMPELTRSDDDSCRSVSSPSKFARFKELE